MGKNPLTSAPAACLLSLLPLDNFFAETIFAEGFVFGCVDVPVAVSFEHFHRDRMQQNSCIRLRALFQ